MTVAAIIAEYNPLHNGHRYHIKETRRVTCADYIITILSGDFVQRGLSAVEEKFERTGKALKAGSDLVLELPLPYALSSAEGFAFGGVSLAEQINCVDFLSFGLEDEKNLETMKELAHAINAQDIRFKNSKALSFSSMSNDVLTGDETGCLSFRNIIENKLKEGLNYPAAYAQAAAASFPEFNTDFLTEKGNSNTILALEYLRALERLGSSITPVAIARRGAAYLSESDMTTVSATIASAVRVNAELHDDYYPSATALRAQLQAAEPSDSPLLFPSDFSALLHYKLLSLTYEDLLQYRGMTPQLAHRMINALPEFTDYEQFANLLWTKDTTYSHVCRQLFCILLDLKKDTWDVRTQVPYARILGFKKSAAPLLHQIRENASIPLISKLADSPSVLSDNAQSLLNLEIKASQIYDSVRYHKCGERLPGEYRKQIVII